MTGKKIKIGIPKGSLEKHTLKIFREAGFNVEKKERSYFLKIDDDTIEAFLIRSQEIPSYVEKGYLDAGISGEDWIVESNAKVKEICDLEYAKRDIKKINWVLAVSKDSKIKSIKDLQGKRISTEITNIAKRYFKEKGIKADVEFSWGATEVKPPLFADGIIDLTETGESLKANNLKVLDIVFKSSTKFFANKDIKDDFKERKINEIGMLLKGAVKGEKAVLVSCHLHKDKLKDILRIIPKKGNPSITKITGTDWHEINFAILEKDTRNIVPKIKRKGAEGIVIIPLNKIVR